jgi:restriction endonuclease S subunit
MPKPPKNRILAKLLAKIKDQDEKIKEQDEKIKEQDANIKEFQEQLQKYAAQDSARKRREQFSASAPGEGTSLGWSDSD